MKSILFFSLLTATALAQQGNDPWQDYEKQGNGHGHGHGHPKVPEPSTYGAVFIAASVSICYFLRKRKK